MTHSFSIVFNEAQNSLASTNRSQSYKYHHSTFHTVVTSATSESNPETANLY